MRVMSFAAAASLAILIASGFGRAYAPFCASCSLCGHRRNLRGPTCRLCMPSLVAMAWGALGANLLAGRSSATLRHEERVGMVRAVPRLGVASPFWLVGQFNAES